MNNPMDYEARQKKESREWNEIAAMVSRPHPEKIIKIVYDDGTENCDSVEYAQKVVTDNEYWLPQNWVTHAGSYVKYFNRSAPEVTALLFAHLQDQDSRRMPFFLAIYSYISPKVMEFLTVD